MTEMKVHSLKILPKFFWPVWRGSKTFEVRRNDRDYMPGDWLDLKEWTEENGYTGAHTKVVVSYVLRSEDATGLLAQGTAVLGIHNPVPTLTCPWCGFPIIKGTALPRTSYRCDRCNRGWEDLVA